MKNAGNATVFVYSKMGKAMKRRNFFKSSAAAVALGALNLSAPVHAEEPPIDYEALEIEPISRRWTEERANRWHKALPWIVGTNYVASYAINQIEMWQNSTVDFKTIDSELALAESIGFNTVRIFAHDLLWESERDAYFDNIRRFLDICEARHIRVVYNVFTNGGKEPSVMGPQPAPIPGVHNGEWRQTPGVEKIMNQPSRWHEVEPYVKDTLATFAEDKRILFWEIFNEPANNRKVKDITGFLRYAFMWARQINPTQPLTASLQYYELTPMNSFLACNSDIMTFHCYSPAPQLAEAIERLEKMRRPIVCTEWMARCLGSTVKDCLPLMKEKNVGALSWGLVPGKLQTNIPWTHLVKENPANADIWFHDYFDENHKPYDPEEIELIKKLSGVKE